MVAQARRTKGIDLHLDVRREEAARVRLSAEGDTLEMRGDLGSGIGGERACRRGDQTRERQQSRHTYVHSKGAVGSMAVLIPPSFSSS